MVTNQFPQKSNNEQTVGFHGPKETVNYIANNFSRLWEAFEASEKPETFHLILTHRLGQSLIDVKTGKKFLAMPNTFLRLSRAERQLIWDCLHWVRETKLATIDADQTSDPCYTDIWCKDDVLHLADKWVTIWVRESDDYYVRHSC